MIHTEFKNYALHFWNPLYAFLALVKLLSRIPFTIFLRFFPKNRIFFIPQHIQKIRRELLTENPNSQKTVPYTWQTLSPVTLTITTQTIKITEEPNWLQNFTDEEVTSSLHRWNWLLRGITDDTTYLTREQGLNLMRSWINRCLYKKTFNQDAYSTGDRIVNGTIFLILTGDHNIPKDIAHAFKIMGQQVAKNLEYYPLGLTGNHAFNNARALLFSGIVSNTSTAIKLATEIIKERLPIMVTSDGFMREESSHYHFLFTRWILEMLWITEKTNHNTINHFLIPYAKKLIEQCWFFLVQDSENQWTIPLIGDISPDCPPHWLLNLPWSQIACQFFQPDFIPPFPPSKGWANLFGLVETTKEKSKKNNVAFSYFYESGWFRIDHYSWILFLHAKKCDGKIRASHKHHDLGSFVLYYNNSPLIIDSGRINYTSSERGLYGKSSYAHNTLMIDNLGATPDVPSWFIEKYSAINPRIDIIENEKSIQLILIHDGFSRLRSDQITHKRIFHLTQESISIEDYLLGHQTHLVDVFFHFSPSISDVKKSHFSWKFKEPCLTFSYNDFNQENMKSGRYSNEYGHEEQCNTLHLSGAYKLPCHFSYSINKGNKKLCVE